MDMDLVCASAQRPQCLQNSLQTAESKSSSTWNPWSKDRNCHGDEDEAGEPQPKPLRQGKTRAAPRTKMRERGSAVFLAARSRRRCSKGRPEDRRKGSFFASARRARGQGRIAASRTKARAGKTRGPRQEQRETARLDGHGARIKKSVQDALAKLQADFQAAAEVRQERSEDLKLCSARSCSWLPRHTHGRGRDPLTPVPARRNCAPAASTPSRTRTTTRWRLLPPDSPEAVALRAAALPETRLADLVCLELEKAVTVS
jgi:hypothetical protein